MSYFATLARLSGVFPKHKINTTIYLSTYLSLSVPVHRVLVAARLIGMTNARNRGNGGSSLALSGGRRGSITRRAYLSSSKSDSRRDKARKLVSFISRKGESSLSLFLSLLFPAPASIFSFLPLSLLASLFVHFPLFVSLIKPRSRREKYKPEIEN